MSEGKVYPKLTKEQILALPKNTALRPRTGRPSIITEEMMAKICDGITSGLSLVKVCAQEGMPDTYTVYEHLVKNKDFAAIYTKAQHVKTEAMFENLVEIADDATPEQAAVMRLRIDTRKWVLARMNPKKYGEKVELEHKGEVAISQITRKVVDPLTIDQTMNEVKKIEENKP